MLVKFEIISAFSFRHMQPGHTVLGCPASSVYKDMKSPVARLMMSLCHLVVGGSNYRSCGGTPAALVNRLLLEELGEHAYAQ